MSNLRESDASHKRAQRFAKKLEKQGKPEKADDALKIAFNKEVVRAKGKNPNPGPATTKLYDRIKTPKTKGQGSFLKMSQSVKESVFNTYRNLAVALLEGRWNTRHLSPADRTARAESDTSHEAPFDKRGIKHVKRREKRLARRSALARESEDQNQRYDDESDGRDYMKDQARKK